MLHLLANRFIKKEFLNSTKKMPLSVELENCSAFFFVEKSIKKTRKTLFLQIYFVAFFHFCPAKTKKWESPTKGETYLYLLVSTTHFFFLNVESSLKNQCRHYNNLHRLFAFSRFSPKSLPLPFLLCLLGFFLFWVFCAVSFFF